MAIDLDKLKSLGVLRGCKRHSKGFWFDEFEDGYDYACLSCVRATVEEAVREALRAALAAEKQDGWSREGWEAKKIAYHAGLTAFGLDDEEPR